MSNTKYLDGEGLRHLWIIIKQYVTSKVPTKTSEITNDSGFITSKDVPAAITIDSALSSSSTNPVQNKVINTALGNKVDKVSGKGLSTNDYTTTEKNKLAGIAANANNYTLPKAGAETLGGVKIGMEFIGESGSTEYSMVHVAENAEDGNLYSRYPNDATTSNDGLMTKAMVTKLSGIAENANNYSLPTASSTLGGVKTTSTVTSTSGYTAVPIINGVPYYKNTTYSTASSSANGLMSKTDKAKLDAFASASDYALKSDITNMYKYKGSVDTYADLPATGNAVGDVWNVAAGGMNYVWTIDGEWDALGEIFTIDAITNAEIDTIVAS